MCEGIFKTKQHLKIMDTHCTEGAMMEEQSRLDHSKWIVPYNPYLTKKFEPHISVEACTTIKSVKYLFKYVYKGHDCASIEVSSNVMNHDEINTFLDALYISHDNSQSNLKQVNMKKR